MTRRIHNRWTGAVLWEGEAKTVKDALHAAIAAGSDLSGSDLSGSDLSGSDLSGSDLSYSDLSYSDLSGSNLSYSNLRGSNLRGSNLRGSNLRGSNLRGSNLRDSNLRGGNLRDSDLRGSNLRDSNLRYSDLRGSNLRGSDLTPIRDDLWAVLSAAPAEAPALLAAIREGRINGSVYEGDCACLVGTLAKARGCGYTEIPGLAPNSSRPIEMFFLAIAPGQTPENHEPSKLAAEWVSEWIERMRAAFGPEATNE